MWKQKVHTESSELMSGSNAMIFTLQKICNKNRRYGHRGTSARQVEVACRIISIRIEIDMLVVFTSPLPRNWPCQTDAPGVRKPATRGAYASSGSWVVALTYLRKSLLIPYSPLFPLLLSWRARRPKIRPQDG